MYSPEFDCIEFITRALIKSVSYKRIKQIIKACMETLNMIFLLILFNSHIICELLCDLCYRCPAHQYSWNVTSCKKKQENVVIWYKIVDIRRPFTYVYQTTWKLFISIFCVEIKDQDNLPSDIERDRQNTDSLCSRAKLVSPMILTFLTKNLITNILFFL